MVRCAERLLDAGRRGRGHARGSASSRRLLPTWASATTRSSTSRSWLFSALAMALSRHFFTSLAIRLRENSRSARAVSHWLAADQRRQPGSACAALTRTHAGDRLGFVVAPGARGVAWLTHGSLPLRFFVGRMAVEGAGRRELAELVADHLLGDLHRDVLLDRCRRRTSARRNAGRIVERRLQILMTS